MAVLGNNIRGYLGPAWQDAPKSIRPALLTEASVGRRNFRAVSALESPSNMFGAGAFPWSSGGAANAPQSAKTLANPSTLRLISRRLIFVLFFIS
jgi:hypothetical protein